VNGIFNCSKLIKSHIDIALAGQKRKKAFIRSIKLRKNKLELKKKLETLKVIIK
jgi:hypothetical protein